MYEGTVGVHKKDLHIHITEKHLVTQLFNIGKRKLFSQLMMDQLCATFQIQDIQKEETRRDAMQQTGKL